MKELLDNPKAYVDILEGFTTRVVSRLAWGTSEAGEEVSRANFPCSLTVYISAVRN